jgi:hypothetical protein
MFFVCNLRPSSQAECRRFDDVQIPKSVVGLDLYQLFGCLQYLVEPSEGNRGDGLLMSSSRAKRTAAMMEAAMTMVKAKRSCVRRRNYCLEIAPIDP